MRFIKIDAELDEFPHGLSVEFDDNISILQIELKSRFDKIKNLFTDSILKLHSGSRETPGDMLDFTLYAAHSGINYIIDSNGRITPHTGDETGNSLPESDSFNNAAVNSLTVYLEKIYRENFSSLICFDSAESDNEPFQINPESLSRILANIDLMKENHTFTDEAEYSLGKTKALSALTKQKELIEIKKMRKEKLQKEITAINRVLNRLSKKLKSLNDFKDTLNSISEKLSLKNRLASKINNSKKEVLESRDLKNRLNTLEKELKAEFPQFKEYGEKISSLEEVEIIFNDLKNINEKIEREKTNSQNVKSRGWKAAGAIIIFSITSLIFLGTKGETGLFPFIAGAAVILTGSVVLSSFFKLKNHDIESLLKEKETHQLKLSSALDNDRFTFENYQTEELYEFLLQYFDDFIRYSELQSEIKGLEEKIGSQPPLKETEKKLDSRNQEMIRLEREIIREMESLDPEILNLNSEEDIDNAVIEINELIAAAEDEIRQEDSIRKKIESEIIDYDRKDNSGTSYDHQLAEIGKEIKNLEDEIKALSFINKVTSDASLTWSSEKLNLMADKAWETLRFISENTGTGLPADYKDRLSHIIKKGGNTRHLSGIPDNYIKIAIIHALGKISTAIKLFPPLIIVLTSQESDNNSILKNLLELFKERQVIIITSAPVQGISGNLIKI